MTPNGTAIRAIRAAQQRSIRDVADAAGISTAYLSEVERGRDASDDVIARIAQALDVPQDAITREGITVTEDDANLRLYNKQQAAQLLGMSVSWIKKAVAARSIPCTFVGGQIRFTAAHLRAITEAGEVVPTQRQLARTA